MRDEMTFANRAALGSISLFPLCRYEIRINTKQVPPLWQDVHHRSSESKPPILLLRSRVSAREQIRQPALPQSFAPTHASWNPPRDTPISAPWPSLRKKRPMAPVKANFSRGKGLISWVGLQPHRSRRGQLQCWSEGSSCPRAR